jgi:hypothetical protein
MQAQLELHHKQTWHTLQQQLACRSLKVGHCHTLHLALLLLLLLLQKQQTRVSCNLVCFCCICCCSAPSAEQ